MNFASHPVVKEVLERSAIPKLNPVQEAALKAGVLEGKNMVVAAPTASGKTLVAEFAALNTIKKGLKTVYIVPLRALASEKYHEFRDKYGPLGVRVGLSMGDLDSSDPGLAKFDFIIVTSEKFDSLLRHGITWADRIGLLVVDEIHLLNDAGRGPTLEITITKLRMLANPQILALSATIKNYKEIAEWLDAKAVYSEYRPVKLYKGVCFDRKIHYHPEKPVKTLGDEHLPDFEVAKDTLRMNKQALIFVSTRSSTEALSANLGRIITPKLSAEDKAKLKKISDSVLNVMERPTLQCEKLSNHLLNGVAFHHAGLANAQRKLIEDGFKEGVIKFITATPTLCLSKDTMIWNGISETRVSDFKDTGHVLALSSNKLSEMKARKIQKINNSSTLIRISSVSGHSIKVTPEHKMLIKRNGKSLVLEAKNIINSDKIATTGKLNISVQINPKIGDFIAENHTTKREHEFDAELSYFIGVMLGDGYSGAEFEGNKIKYKGPPCIVGNDIEVFEHVSSLCRNLNLHCKKGKNYYGTTYLRLSKGKWFREFLVRCGVDKGDKKHISEKLMKMKLNNTSALIRGLFDTDGYVDKNRGPGFSNTSEGLIKQTQKLLLRFGIVSSIRTKKAKTMNVYGKEYATKPCLELSIHQKKSIMDFYSLVGFGIGRKQRALKKFIDKFNLNIKYVSCSKCSYRIYKELFSGRTKEQKIWGAQKLRIINILGQKKELGSREIKELIDGNPRKNDLRLNHHYELIKKRKMGKIDKTEWFWSLNEIGRWIFNNITAKNGNLDKFLMLNDCPLCGNRLGKVIKKGWRDSDFDGDIFWDIIRSIKSMDAEENVYDLVISDKPKNDHMFVANGFIVHNSWGVNLPAYRVVIRDLKRFSSGFGSDYIPALEVQQMMGRAGRPKYDSEGEAILIAKSEGEAEYVYDNYITGEPEEIQSKLGVEPVLRMHSLALIASGLAFSKQKLFDFFSRTFYAKQYGDLSLLNRKIENVLDMLKDFGFVKGEKAGGKENPFRKASDISKGGENLEATLIGRRVSELYIDPLTANYMIKNLTKAGDAIHPFALLHLISRTLEMRPALSLRKKDFEKVNELIVENEKLLLEKPPNPWDVEYEDYIRSLKTAWFFSEWMNEMGEDRILENFGVAPGELHVRLSNADWLIYSAQELSLLLGLKGLLKHIRKTRLRVKYGIAEELLPLVMLRGIGRVRARMLFGSNLRSLADLRKIPLESLSRVIGPKVAKDVKEQLNEIKEEQMTIGEMKEEQKTI